MKRREFIALGGAAVIWPLAASAQQAGVPIVGFLHAGSPQSYAQQVTGFLQGLSEGAERCYRVPLGREPILSSPRLSRRYCAPWSSGHRDRGRPSVGARGQSRDDDDPYCIQRRRGPGPLALRAPQREQPYRLGLLLNRHLAEGIDALVAEMRRLGYEEGRNLLLDWRLVETADRNDVLAADLVSLKPDLLVGAGSQQVYALKRATPSIPSQAYGTAQTYCGWSHQGHQMQEC